MPQGQRPQMPNGEQGTPPEMPEGMERPEMPNDAQGAPPEMPEGMGRPTPPDGDRPEFPNGMTPPAHEGGMMDGNRIPGGENSTTFTLTKGGNYFSNVSPAVS